MKTSKRILPIVLLLLGLSSPSLADTGAEIDHLLAYVRQSDATYIRNGQEYKALEAAGHFQKKREHFTKEIKTTEDFVAKAATKSLVSGQSYLVRSKDGDMKECGVWLLEELARFRQGNRGVPNN